MSELAQFDPFLIETFYTIVGAPVFLLLWIVTSLMELAGPATVFLWMLYFGLDVGEYLWDLGLHRNAVMFGVMSAAVCVLAIVDIQMSNELLLQEEQKIVGNWLLG